MDSGGGEGRRKAQRVRKINVNMRLESEPLEIPQKPKM